MKWVMGLLSAWLMAMPQAMGQGLDSTHQISQYVTRHWDSADGLLSDKVQAFAQGPDGYLWIGTEGGLVRFDGVHFIAFMPDEDPEFGTISVRALLTGRDGSIWIGRDDGVVGRYKGGRLEVFRASGTPPPTLIRGIVEDRSGTIWIGAYEGLFRVMDRGLVPLPVKTGMIYSLFLDAEGLLWIPTDGLGVFVLREGQLVTHITRAQGLPGSVVYSVSQGRDGTLWLGTAHGVAARRNGHWVLLRSKAGLPEGNVRALMTDRHDRLWAGTWSGLARWGRDRFEALRAGQGLVDDAINALYEDREGVIWVGTRGGGLQMFRRGSARSHSQASGLPRNDVSAVLEDRRGRVWVTFDQGPPAVYQKGVWSRFDEGGILGTESIKCMAEDRAGGIWFSTQKGLFHLREGHSVVERMADLKHIESMLAARTGGLWLVIGQRLFSWGVHGLAQRPYDQAAFGTPQAIFHERPDGALLLGTSFGLVAYRLRESSLLWKASSPETPITALHEDGQGTLWFAPEGQGLVRLGRDGSRVFTRRDGLPSDWVSQILMDDSRTLWLGTHQGIVSIPSATLPAAGPAPTKLPWRVFTIRDGLKSTFVESFGEPAAMKARDGILWFPTSQGVTTIDPREILATPALPPLVIETIRVDGRQWQALEADAPPGRGDLEVAFTSPLPGSGDQIRFRYRLDGFDQGWQETTQRSLRYTKLPPGTYYLNIAAARTGGTWSALNTQAKITLRPRFHQTGWFLVLMGIALVGLLLAAHALRTRRLRARARSLVLHVEQALAQVKVLSGLLPTCASCKRIRDESGSWKQMESYIRDHSEAQFSHGCCPDCAEKLYPGFVRRDVRNPD